MGRVSRFVMPLCAALCLCGAAFAQEQLGLETANDAAGTSGIAVSNYSLNLCAKNT